MNKYVIFSLLFFIGKAELSYSIELQGMNTCKNRYDMCVNNCNVQYDFDNLKALKACLKFCKERLIDCVNNTSSEELE